MLDRNPQQRPRPRKAPKQARSVETVRVIVEAAARVLEQHGMDGFSTNAVAERAGVSIGSLYQYFPRKEALIGALILRETSLLIEDAEAARAEPSGTAALSALIRACVAHQLRRPTLARLLDFEEAHLPFDVDTERVKERLRMILSEMLQRPDLPCLVEIHAAVRDVTAIIKGMVDTAGVYGETDQHALSLRVRRAVFGYLNGYS
ncbi:MAG TPA: TetR/AcrR family transcriptional regulator [Rhodopila sp.]|uniref:TetR/AcrR family transcriptional regulator n=1 Tax=Rhodopila sp. TaxID=2480087 RepID=UPI002C759D91|nr:TetR/AcrR family transcriptional regulator [Rhodopila sp.]HVY15563.1 TetR/AcrR family transcriptional regulator [Rhodopila sp.]